MLYQEIMKNIPQMGDTILLVTTGSSAYGVATEESDLDIRGIYVPSKKVLFGFTQGNGVTTGYQQGRFDFYLHDIRKYMKLAAEGSHNMIEYLWVPEEMIEHASNMGNYLIGQRDIFNSKALANSIVRHAKSCLYQITKYPSLTDVAGGSVFAKEGMHAMRLIQMASEFLTYRRLVVRRPNADKLMYLRTHGFVVKNLVNEFNEAKEYIDSVLPTSALPDIADVGAILTMCQDVIADHYGFDIYATE